VGIADFTAFSKKLACMEKESSAHIICDCMALFIRRNRLVGMYVVPWETTAALNPKKNSGIYTVHWTSGGSLSHERVVQ